MCKQSSLPLDGICRTKVAVAQMTHWTASDSAPSFFRTKPHNAGYCTTLSPGIDAPSWLMLRCPCLGPLQWKQPQPPGLSMLLLSTQAWPCSDWWALGLCSLDLSARSTDCVSRLRHMPSTFCNSVCSSLSLQYRSPQTGFPIFNSTYPIHRFISPAIPTWIVTVLRCWSLDVAFSWKLGKWF